MIDNKTYFMPRRGDFQQELLQLGKHNFNGTFEYKNIIDMVFETSNKIKNHRHPTGVFNSIVEEVGELSKEMRVLYDPTCYKKGDEDGVIGESCDILIGVLDLLYLHGYDKKTIEVVLATKLRKWESKVNEAMEKRP
ncbi:MAG: hypothetical protein ACRCRT_01490 [Cetobacterium somerae]